MGGASHPSSGLTHLTAFGLCKTFDVGTTGVIAFTGGAIEQQGCCELAELLEWDTIL